MDHLFPVRPNSPSKEEVQAGIRECLKVQGRAVQNGKPPFGACLMGPDNSTVLLMQGNVDHVNHAESTLARSAAAQFTQEYLWTCTLYSTWEPCAMCTSTIYWAHIGRIVYAASNDQLMELTGKNNLTNMTMKWHCRDILSGSQKDIKVIGPISGIDRVVIMESDVYWSQTSLGTGPQHGNP
ncbi:cytidine deaminase-like protein [Viridothelium virens]|uniref:Cytidine deaminase-like protein n=1 Tax=Viridothelium virens TaxID=1048519 RepID=A0A6A6HDE1_VIRVR|nr:cytidine deaminase-like protein [Viridothelium virens]